MFQEQSFSHHGHAFTIEAEGWQDEETACAVIIDLQTWAFYLGPEETAALHAALTREVEALVHDVAYDRNAASLPSLREAQRNAVKNGLQGEQHRGVSVSLEAARNAEA